MRTVVISIGLATAFGLTCASNASAVPVSGGALHGAADATLPLQPAQYSERQTRHGVVKCYREFVIGPYRCHYFR